MVSNLRVIRIRYETEGIVLLNNTFYWELSELIVTNSETMKYFVICVQSIS